MRWGMVLAVAVVACGGGQVAVVEPVAPSTADADAGSGTGTGTGTGTEVAKGIPGACAGGVMDPCVPEADFVKRMCNGMFPDVALILFAKGSPFTRGYLKGDVDGWNADGASARAKLLFDEEVLVLRKRDSGKGGMQVSGSGGYQVMRWDGYCYTLEEGSLATRAPAKPKTSAIPWRFMENSTKDALLADAGVKTAYEKRGKECKGAVSGDVTAACQKADEALSAAIVKAVRDGISVPTPGKLP